ncbi:MAG: EamA family transporter [Deltaproteobacteria bacterium]|nr:EamA family transporter [Deltaproteobacteria bacterium]
MPQSQGAFATTVYFFASSILSSRKASSFVFLVPFSAVILSWFFLGEVPRINTIAGGSLAIGAVYIINQR